MNRLLFFLLIAVSLGACKGAATLTNTNLAEEYKREYTTIQPEYQVYHVSDTLTQLYFQLEADQLAYRKIENEDSKMASVRFHYRVYENYENPVIVDSSTVEIADVATGESGRTLIGDIKMRVPGIRDYLLEITATDLFQGRSYKQFIPIEKTALVSRQNYLVEDAQSELPIFGYYINGPGPYRLTNKSIPTGSLTVRYYDREFGLAAPPFSMYNQRPFNYEADSIFEIERTEDGYLLETSKRGFYHILANPDSKIGLTLFNFNGSYPTLKTVDELVEPLRFITSKKEYQGIVESNNPKEALDNFWLDNTINEDRARELIKQFYSRVESSNFYFSSHVPGWKTDRGMIFLIFGPPNVVYRSSTTETWVYGEENNFMSLTFNFIKVNNPFSDNDFMLNRSPIYKNAWYRAVDSWRQGRIYTN